MGDDYFQDIIGQREWVGRSVRGTRLRGWIIEGVMPSGHHTSEEVCRCCSNSAEVRIIRVYWWGGHTYRRCRSARNLVASISSHHRDGPGKVVSSSRPRLATGDRLLECGDDNASYPTGHFPSMSRGLSAFPTPFRDSPPIPSVPTIPFVRTAQKKSPTY